MSSLSELLATEVEQQSRDKDAAVLLSGGLDSLTVALTLKRFGKNISAYTYALNGYRSQDCAKSEAIARHYGWPITVITIDPGSVCSDFVTLAIEHGCRKKVQFECTYVLLHMFPEIREREVWTGYNADDYFGNTKKAILTQAPLIREGASQSERKRVFAADVAAHVSNLHDPESEDTWWFAHRLAAQHGIRLHDPYLSPSVGDYFGQFDHSQLCSPKKPIVREAFADDLRGLPSSDIAVGVKLQKGGGVHLLFETLLNKSYINRFERRYTTVSALCQRWGKEVAKDRDRLLSELSRQDPPPLPQTALQKPAAYQPYNMDDVRRASSTALFTAIVTFAGGGGSSTGYQLAGGQVLLTNEFVPEAARTYRRNFPDCIVDGRDIRAVISDVEAFLAQAGLKPGDLDILDGSPPCSEFSVAGKGISDQNLLRSYSDVKQKNIASLPFEFVDLAIQARPKVVACENVPAFATRGKEVFFRALNALKYPDGGADRAYFVNWTVLSANDFGVAQKRRRLFIIGIRRDVGEALGINSDEAVLSLFPKPTSAGVNIRSALSGLSQTAHDILPWTTSVRTTGLARLIRHLPKTPDRCTGLSDVIPGYTKHFTLRRTAWDLPAPTMTVTSQKPDGMTGMIHPEQDRKFTLPELKRLTSLPDDFILTGTLSQATERICRMVPPLLTKAIAENLYQLVLKPFRELTS